MRIDEKTLVPIGWVVSVFTAVVISSITGTFWVASWMSSVDKRLSRIEEKVGLSVYHASESFIEEAHAK